MGLMEVNPIFFGHFKKSRLLQNDLSDSTIF